MPSRVAAFVAISALYEVVGPHVLRTGPRMIELARNELAARRALFEAPSSSTPASGCTTSKSTGPLGAVQRMVDRLNAELGHSV